MDKLEKVEHFFNEDHHFQRALKVLRELALSAGVEETYKWQFPTYTVGGKNVFALCKFKGHFGIWFFNGVFLKDPLNVLQNAQEGKTMAMRRWKFSSLEEIDQEFVEVYLKEAIENQKQGKVLATIKKKAEKIQIPALLSDALRTNKKIKAAFEELSTYKQNEYSEYITSAKQEKTKLKRLEKAVPLIEQGKGLNDRYK